MPYMYIKGVGKVEVDKLPEKIPKTVTIAGKKFPVDEEMYKLVWAVEHATPRERERIKGTVFEGSLEEFRKVVKDELKNTDLEDVAIDLVNAIEYMINSTSNLEKKGVYSFDVSALKNMLKRAKDRLEREVL